MSAMDVHFSSASVTWDTPDDFYARYNSVYNFTLDPCCMDNSAKCVKYYTPETDGLSHSWAGETVFMNPPYGRVIGKWIKKAFDESLNAGTIVVCLLPARTDTKWFNEYCTKGQIQFVTGRLKFVNKSNPDWQTTKFDPAPFPSMVVIFGGDPALAGTMVTVPNK